MRFGPQKQVWAGSCRTQDARLTAVFTGKHLWEDRKVSREQSHALGRLSWQLPDRENLKRERLR